MKNILLLTDFSINSKNAHEYALNFFEKEFCMFYLLHVHKMGSFTTDNLLLSSSNSNIYESIIEVPKKKNKSLIEGYQKKFANNKHKFESIVDFDDFTDAINQVIKLNNIDLIVLGSNGKTGAKEIVFGSNTLNVIRKVNCTTLVISEGCKYLSNKEVLLPLDTRGLLHGKALKKLREFLSAYELNLNVLRLESCNDECEYEFHDQSNLISLAYKYFEIKDVPVQYAIKSFIQIKSIGITVIFVHDENLFQRLFFGSSTTKISNSLKEPLLIFHND
jgi:nucleotide-binding universal stress UspA family protein